MVVAASVSAIINKFEAIARVFLKKILGIFIAGQEVALGRLRLVKWLHAVSQIEIYAKRTDWIAFKFRGMSRVNFPCGHNLRDTLSIGLI